MVALAILGAGLLAMLAMQVSALRQGRSGRDFTEAARIAQQQMELLHRIDWDAPAMQPQPWTPAVATAGFVTGGGGGGPQVAQNYNVQYRVQATGDPTMRTVDVRVTWTEPGAPPAAPPRRYAISSARHDDP
jgi:Tfp pilus assembly protein PilV